MPNETTSNNSSTTSILIVGGSEEERSAKSAEMAAYYLKVSPQDLPNCPDFSVINDDYGIDAVRSITRTLSFKPYTAQKKVIVIAQAQNLTFHAQNALLKLLEEPNQSSVIILSAENSQQLLATVVSRCRLNFLSNRQSENLPDQKEALEKITRFYCLTLFERLENNAVEYKKAEKLDELLNIWMAILRNQMLLAIETETIDQTFKLTASQLLFSIENLQTALDLLSSNVSTQLVMDYLALSFPKVGTADISQ